MIKLSNWTWAACGLATGEVSGARSWKVPIIQRARKAVVVYMEERSFNGFASNIMGDELLLNFGAKFQR